MDNLAIQQKAEPLLSLDGLYANDIWDLSQCERYILDGQSKKEGTCTLTFAFSHNEEIKQEIKAFIKSLIEEKKFTLTNVLLHQKFIKLYLGFMEKNHPEVCSILELSLAESEKQFQLYIEESNCKVFQSNKAAYIDRQLIEKRYTQKTREFSLFRKLYSYIEDISLNQDEYDKDTWDVRKMGFGHKVAKFQPYYTIPFTRIRHPWLKEAAKQFSLHRLRTKAISTVRTDLKGVYNLSEFLAECHPEIQKLGQLDRAIMEEFISWISRKGYKPKPFNHLLTGVRNMFAILLFLEYEDVPSKKLILDSDYRRNPSKEPEFFSDRELKRLNEHLHELPAQIARMVFVIENVGMRISDLCCMEDNCITRNENGEFTLRYYQSKTGEYNTIPVEELVGLTIEEAIRESKDKYGKACRYVFAAAFDRPFVGNTFRAYLRKLAKDNNLKYDDGTPFNIKTHTFRGTVATQYANLGISLELIRLLLGHADLSSLKHYVTIHSTTMIECMRPITEMDNEMIANIGHVGNVVSLEPESMLLALPNGSCAHADLSTPCTHANACYTCRMFRPSKCHLPLYKKQLLDTERNIAIAEINGYERLLEMNNTLKSSLIKIIDAIEKDG